MKKTIRMLSAVAMTLTPLLSIQPASANITDPMIGEISYFAGTFAPRGWAFCDGQLLPINQYQALFSLLGTTYGGDGRTTFALPDMRGRVALHQGTGPGLTQRAMGQKLGTEEMFNVLPQHNHVMSVSSDTARATVATGRSLASTSIYTDDTPNVSLHTTTIGTVGSSQAVNNVQPSITAQCIISLIGTFPSRN